MSSYANELIPEVETPYCRSSVQAQLLRRRHVQYGNHKRYSLVAAAYSTIVVQIVGGRFCKARLDILCMQMKKIPRVEHFACPSAAKDCLWEACMPNFVHVHVTAFAREPYKYQLL